MKENFTVVVLAAGHGKRMQSALPKVLVLFRGKPMIAHLLKSIEDSGVGTTPTIIVGQKADMVRAALGDTYNYVFQAEQLGTAHAIMATEESLKGRAEHIWVLYGDQPTITSATIATIAKTHIESGAVLTMGTLVLPDFEDWRSVFKDFSRIIRDTTGKLIRSIEKKDLTEEQMLIKEVNPALMCFQAKWLWDNIHKITNDNFQKEYYLTDLIRIAVAQNDAITTIAIDPKEALGVNTKEQIEFLEKIT